MILLTSTSDLLQVVTTATGTGTCDVHASYVDLASGSVTASRANTRISTPTTTTVVGSPAASTTRNVKQLNIGNNHASLPNTITLQHTDGTNVVVIEVVTLAAMERMSYAEGIGIRVFDALGREKLQTAKAPTEQSTMLTDQTTGAVDVYITGSDFPIAGRIQAGSVIRWTMTATKSAAGVAAPIWNIRFGTAGAIADTARCTMTGAAQTGVADTARIEISATIRTYSSSGIVQGTMGGDHLLATTGFSVGGFANQALSSAFDLTVAGLKAGISVNPGTSAAWTFKTCNIEGLNLLA